MPSTLEGLLESIIQQKLIGAPKITFQDSIGQFWTPCGYFVLAVSTVLQALSRCPRAAKLQYIANKIFSDIIKSQWVQYSICRSTNQLQDNLVQLMPMKQQILTDLQVSTRLRSKVFSLLNDMGWKCHTPDSPFRMFLHIF